MGGKPETGKLDDPDLLALIDQPRCGMPDVGPSDNARRKRRYTLQGSRWHKKVMLAIYKTPFQLTSIDFLFNIYLKQVV